MTYELHHARARPRGPHRHGVGDPVALEVLLKVKNVVANPDNFIVLRLADSPDE